MKTTLNCLLVPLLLASVVGCASKPKELLKSSYYTANQPTIESIKQTGGEGQIFKKTFFMLSDFSENGEIRPFLDYDFTKESSPCTALGSAYQEPAVFKSDIFFTVEIGDNAPHHFVCRSRNQSNEYRLYLVGSQVECLTRTWAMDSSAKKSYRNMAKQCVPGFRTKLNEQIEAQYLNSFGQAIVQNPVTVE